MDLDAYIERYSGETRLRRLLFIAQRCEDRDVLASVSSKIARHLKEDGNVKKYRELVHANRVGEAPGGDATHSQGRVNVEEDPDWEKETEAANKQARLVLQGRLAAAQSNLNKEAIRTAYVALAQHIAKTGETQDALSLLLRATDYCTARQQTASISLSILELGLNIESYSHVREYVRYIEYTLGYRREGQLPGATSSTASQSPSVSSSASQEQSTQFVAAKMKIASSLERMAQGDLASAATSLFGLVTTTPSEQWSWPSVVSAEDVALYAAVLCLATQDRQKIVALSEHQEALELVPSMKAILLQFTRSKYKACCEPFQDTDASGQLLAQSNGIPPTMDLYVARHWPRLCAMIQAKCVVEYMKPFQKIKIDRMQADFPGIQLRKLLSSLIGRGLIPGARLDLRENVIVKPLVKDVRSESEYNLHRKVAAVEASVAADSLALLVRLACFETGIAGSASRRRGQEYESSSGRATFGQGRYVDESSSEDGDTPMLDAQQNPEDVY